MASVEERLSALEGRLQEHADRFGEVSEMFRHIDRKIDALRAEMLSQFRWTIGLLLTLAAGILTAAAGILTAVLRR